MSQSRRAQRCAAPLATSGLLGAGLVLLALAGVATAQEALRYSLAGQDMAEYRKRALENANYDVMLGPVGLRLSAGLGIAATDNVRLVENNPQADLSFSPQVNVFSEWRVTEKNSLTLGMGIGYTKYIVATDYDRFFITPDTDLSFDIYAGDFKINVHDAFSYSGDVGLNPSVSRTGSLPVFQNMIGVGAIWDLNKASISAGYDHQNYIVTEDQYDNQTHTSELLTAAVGFQLRPTVQAGFQLGGGFLNYAQTLSRDNQHFSLGPFASGRLSEYTSYRLSVGYVIYFLDAIVLDKTASTINALSDALSASTINALYVDGSISQRVGKLLNHTFGISRSLQPDTGSQVGARVLDLLSIRHSASWNILRKTGVGTSLSYEHGTESGVFGETFDRYGAGISLSRQLTKQASGSVGYQFYLKNSDRNGDSYLQNRLVLNITYVF